MTSKITQDHWRWHRLIGHYHFLLVVCSSCVYLAPFPRY